MYKENRQQLEFEDFYLPFGGKLSSDNRWVKKAKAIPWDEFEEGYKSTLADTGMGAPAKSVRIALGALIIKETLKASDEETVEQIRENPYLQYFLGYSAYSEEAPFDPSMFVHFRKRLSGILPEVNERMIESLFAGRTEGKKGEENSGEKGGGSDSGAPTGENKGKLIVDATCAPSDIAYPTDLKLLNEAREKAEKIIDRLHEPLKGKEAKPRTYRKRARRDFLKTAKSKKPKAKKLRKAIGKQLRYLSRDLKHIDKLIAHPEISLSCLSKKKYRDLLVISELYRQQEQMYSDRVHRIENRIVSISQPHIRPIVRGKARTKTEFGAKVSASLVDGFIRFDSIGWDNYNESKMLTEQIEGFRERHGCYPESVHADKIYRTRENRRYCRKHGIRLSGPPLGRPKKVTEENYAEIKAEKEISRQDELDRIPIEGKFGQGKRRFSLGCIMSKLRETSECAIQIIALVMNLEKWLKRLFFSVFLSSIHLVASWVGTRRSMLPYAFK